MPSVSSCATAGIGTFAENEPRMVSPARKPNQRLPVPLRGDAVRILANFASIISLAYAKRPMAKIPAPWTGIPLPQARPAFRQGQGIAVAPRRTQAAKVSPAYALKRLRGTKALLLVRARIECRQCARPYALHLGAVMGVVTVAFVQRA